MADSLFSILAQKNFDEPPEMPLIASYIREHFQVSVEVIVREHDILISSPSASLAGALRFHLPQIKKAAQTDKRIVLRIR